MVVLSEKVATLSANSTGLDQTAPKEQSDLGLHCLLRLICTIIYYSYGNFLNSLRES